MREQENSTSDTGMTRFMEVSYGYKKKKLVNIPVVLKRFFADHMFKVVQYSFFRTIPFFFELAIKQSFLTRMNMKFSPDICLRLKFVIMCL